MKRLALILALTLSAPALGDIVHLNDGTSVEGTVTRTRDGYLVTDASGKKTTVPAEAVKSFELRSSSASGSGAEERLASLRRAVVNLDDLRQIVDRYKQFVTQMGGTPAGKDAEQDLAQWQDRLDKKMVKAGKEWVTPEQLTQLQARSRDAAAKALPLIAAGKLTEGTALIDQALTVTPSGGELLYLKGVILNRQGQLVPARNAFQGAAAALPDHAPSHNNIAVILWKTRQQMPAMLEFDKAMIASPQNQTILDNVAESLHSLPNDYRKNDLVKRVVEHFNAQDAALQRQMAERGLYRWGSLWIDAQEYGAIQTQLKTVQDKLDAMQKEFTANATRLDQIRQQLNDDQQSLALITQQSFMIGANGNAVQFPLPQRYYDIQRDDALMQNEARVKQGQQVELSRQANEEKARLPQPRYTGMQKSFEIEGMPGMGNPPVPVAAGATTAPARSASPASAPATTGPATGHRGGGDY